MLQRDPPDLTMRKIDPTPPPQQIGFVFLLSAATRKPDS
jgi:hypothetical protein